MKEELSCLLEEPGVLSVMIVGITLMHQWSADNLECLMVNHMYL